jgi:uncharacterized protein
MKLRTLIGLLSAWLLLLILISYLLAFFVIHPSTDVKAQWNQRLKEWGMDAATTPLSRHQLGYDDVIFETEDGLQLSAWFIPVENSTKAIITFHGGNTDRRAFLDSVSAWHEAGFNILMPDYRNHGSSATDEAGLSFGLRESRDGIAALQWLIGAQSMTDIGLVGASLGSAAALMTASKSDRVGALVLQSTGYNFAQLYKNVMPFLPDYFAYNAARMLLWLTGVNFVDALNLNYPLLAAARQITIPVLFVHGSDDKIVKSREAKDLYRTIRSPKEFWLIDGMGHETATNKEPESYPQKIAQFFKQYL